MGFLQEGDGEKISLKDATVFETSSKNTTHTFTVWGHVKHFPFFILTAFFSVDFVTSSANNIVSFFTQDNGGVVLRLEISNSPRKKTIGKLLIAVVHCM